MILNKETKWQAIGAPHVDSTTPQIYHSSQNIKMVSQYLILLPPHVNHFLKHLSHPLSPSSPPLPVKISPSFLSPSIQHTLPFFLPSQNSLPFSSLQPLTQLCLTSQKTNMIRWSRRSPRRSMVMILLVRLLLTMKMKSRRYRRRVRVFLHRRIFLLLKLFPRMRCLRLLLLLLRHLLRLFTFLAARNLFTRSLVVANVRISLFLSLCCFCWFGKFFGVFYGCYRSFIWFPEISFIHGMIHLLRFCLESKILMWKYGVIFQNFVD